MLLQDTKEDSGLQDILVYSGTEDTPALVQESIVSEDLHNTSWTGLLSS